MTFIIQIAISLAIGFLSAPRMQALIISIRIIIIEIRVIRTRRGVVIIRLHRLLLLLGAVPAATAITADNITVIMILISIGATVIVTLQILTGWNSCPALVVIIFVINFVIIFVIIVIVIVIS